jgi:hypothetical protein
MSIWTVTLVSMAIGLLLVIGGAVVMYMGSLVKSAYELKVEVQADITGGFQKIEEENDKKLRWVKRDLVEDIEKAKAAMQLDNTKKFNDLSEAVAKRLTELDEVQQRERAEMLKVIDGLRRDVMALDQRTRGRPPHRPGAAKPADANEAGEDAPQASIPALPAPSETPVATPVATPAAPVGTTA